MKITRRTFVIGIIALAYLAVAASGLAWMIYGVSVSGAALKDRVAAIEDKNAKVRAYTELSSLMDETKAERAELTQYVLTEDQTSSFLTDVETLGKTLGVTLTTLSLKAVEHEDSFNELVVEFAVEGNAVNVEHMLKAFEVLPYHSSVRSLSLVRGNNGMVKSTIAVSVTLLGHVK